jgi:hypothetical protein
MRSLRLFASTSTALLVGMTPGLASAFNTFPPWIQTQLDLGYTLTYCQICHNNPLGGIGTVTMPFGVAMKTEGNLVFSSTQAEVDAALADVAKNMIDSDCNGIPDIQQLKDGRNPNPPGQYIDDSGRPTPDDEPDGGCAGTGAPPPPNPVLYGCGAQLAPAAPSWEGASAAGLVAVLGLARALRPRRRR